MRWSKQPEHKALALSYVLCQIRDNQSRLASSIIRADPISTKPRVQRSSFNQSFGPTKQVVHRIGH